MNIYELNELKNDVRNSNNLKYISTYLTEEEKQLIREECIVSNSQQYDKVSDNEIQCFIEHQRDATINISKNYNQLLMFYKIPKIS